LFLQALASSFNPSMDVLLVPGIGFAGGANPLYVGFEFLHHIGKILIYGLADCLLSHKRRVRLHVLGWI